MCEKKPNVKSNTSPYWNKHQVYRKNRIKINFKFQNLFKGQILYYSLFSTNCFDFMTGITACLRFKRMIFWLFFSIRSRLLIYCNEADYEVIFLTFVLPVNATCPLIGIWGLGFSHIDS